MDIDSHSGKELRRSSGSIGTREKLERTRARRRYVMTKEAKVVMGKYMIGRTLGEGGFGTVKFARHVATGEPFAIKILERHSVLARKFHNQVSFAFFLHSCFYSPPIGACVFP